LVGDRGPEVKKAESQAKTDKVSFEEHSSGIDTYDENGNAAAASKVNVPVKGA